MSDESLRSGNNEYPGCVYGKIRSTEPGRIRLDFNPSIEHTAGEGTRADTFHLRMFEASCGGVEICVKLTTEQWLDLISAMKAAVEDADGWREMFDKLDAERGPDWDAAKE